MNLEYKSTDIIGERQEQHRLAVVHTGKQLNITQVTSEYNVLVQELFIELPQEIVDFSFIELPLAIGFENGWTSENIPPAPVLAQAIVKIARINPEFIFPLLARDLNFNVFGSSMEFFLQISDWLFDPFVFAFELLAQLPQEDIIQGFIQKVFQILTKCFENGQTMENILPVPILAQAIAKIAQIDSDFIFPLLERNPNFNAFGSSMSFFLQESNGAFDPFSAVFCLYKIHISQKGITNFFSDLIHFIKRSTRNDYFYNLLGSLSECLVALAKYDNISKEDASHFVQTMIAVLNVIFPSLEAMNINANEIIGYQRIKERTKNFQTMLQMMQSEESGVIEEAMGIVELILTNYQKPEDIPYCTYEFLGYLMLSTLEGSDLEECVRDLAILWHPQSGVYPYSLIRCLFPIIGYRLLHLAQDHEVRVMGRFLLERLKSAFVQHLADNTIDSVDWNKFVQETLQNNLLEDKLLQYQSYVKN